MKFDIGRGWLPAFDELQREMDRYLQHMTQKKPRSVAFARRTWQPALDVYETESMVVATAELPGVHLEDIDLVVTRTSLTLRGERKPPGGVTERRYSCMEIPFGPFERTAPLPAPVDPEATTAAYRAGFLEVTMPKLVVGPRQVTVRVE